MEWTTGARRADAPALLPSLTRRLGGRYLDWEDWLTFALAVGALLGVSLSLEGAGWTRDMPAITLVGFVALLFAFVIARSPLHMVFAWPLAAIAGAAVTFWQTLTMVGPGDLGQRTDAIYFRFETWFQMAFSGGISNDPLPFSVMIVGVTWTGVFLFGWSLYRWHNAWLGLIPGGIALFLTFAFIDSALSPSVLLFVLCGLTLVMRTSLMARIREWRRESVSYPPLISLSFLHFTLWAVLFLLVASWAAPVGPFPTPTAVNSLAERFEGLGVHFARLAGPLHVKKIAPVHDYTSVLPFQGSIDLSEREMLAVTIEDPSIEGPVVLRGAVYEEYASGGWKAGPRKEAVVSVPLGDLESLGEEGSGGRIIPLTVEVLSKSVVGTVLFSPGQPLTADVPARARFSQPSVTELRVTNSPLLSRRSSAIYLGRDQGFGISDMEVMRMVPERWSPLYVKRNESGRVTTVGAVPSGQTADVLVLSPVDRVQEGESYSIIGFIPDVDREQLAPVRTAPPPGSGDTYVSLPDLPERVRQLASQLAAEATSDYERIKAIETYLRQYPVDFAVEDTPPGQDTVDYFLFESRRGYFDYHASAMVVMLRSLGIPSRLGVGFVTDAQAGLDEEEVAEPNVVQHQDAYAWVEVYFPGHGWIYFNPSPDRPADLYPKSQGDDISVSPVSLEDIRDLPVAAGALLGIQGNINLYGELSSEESGASSSSSSMPWALLVIAGFLAAVAGAFALGWRRSVAGLPYPQQVWEKTVRLSSWGGQPPAPGQTPSDFAAALSRRFYDIPDIGLLARAYNRSRFGHKDDDPSERERLSELWAALRGRLFWGVARRLWRRS